MAHGTSKRIRSGVSQLTIVEHSLCPLDARVSGRPNLIHEATFRFSDKQKKRRTATARVLCPLGLSPKDELILWGLLSLTLANPESGGELHATRHYMLRKLGLINTKSRRGGRQYIDFTAAIKRIEAVSYQCDKFYDPVRAEHRRMGFGFFSYDMPVEEDSKRAWRIVWDPIFFELAQATGSYLRFNLDVYRELDVAGRRLYLFLSKVFYRRTISPRLNVVDVAEQILGVAESVSTRDKKDRVMRCIAALRHWKVIGESQATRVRAGTFIMVLHRGSLLSNPMKAAPSESPLFEPLTDIGFDVAGANRILRRYDQRVVREWIDITLAARERFGATFFSTSPPAFLTDNVKNASAGKRTPPDWWNAIRKEEQRAAAKRAKAIVRSSQEVDPLQSGAIAAIDDVHATIMQQFIAAGQSPELAHRNAQQYQSALRKKTKPK